MVFSSLLFLFVFLPVALAVFYAASSATRHQVGACCATLTALSIAFYFWGSGIYVVLIVGSILLNYWGGRLLTRSHGGARTAVVVSGVCINLGVLAYFKYSRFFLDNLGALAGRELAPAIHPDLPVGVSFFTFMSISYLVDIYRREQQPASLTKFATYLTLFPHLVAGPIVRFREIAADLDSLRRPSAEDFNAGVFRFAQGLGMKVLLADNLALTADRIFGLQPADLPTGVAWLGALAYTFQIYFDFAGYSAMAIGLALMFGFRFPENFDQPYRAASVTEFWRRWHMTLSRFLRDYVYIPLGGNRSGSARTYLNLVMVFFICGLWHGAAWTFVVWGLYQGGLLIGERVLKSRFGFEPTGAPGTALTFLLTCLGWVIFRADSLPHAGRILRAMFGFDGATILAPDWLTYMDPLLVCAMVLAAVFSFTPASAARRLLQTTSTAAFSLRSAGVLILLVVGSAYAVANSYKPFIYFRF
jgi:alginate O-acetyltransferase complex protein AlgI